MDWGWFEDTGGGRDRVEGWGCVCWVGGWAGLERGDMLERDGEGSGGGIGIGIGIGVA